jgi:hypothetical protein
MKVRIYTNTKTRINENWNPYGLINSKPSNDIYKDPLIVGKPGDSNLQQEFYQKIGIDIVTETVFNYPGVQLTEKIIRPIVNKRPFIVVGAAHSLEYLRSKGLKTFSPFINEGYDLIDDPVNRIQFILNEVDRIAKVPVDTIQNFVLEYTPVLEHNFNVLKNLEKQELAEVADRLSKL